MCEQKILIVEINHPFLALVVKVNGQFFNTQVELHIFQNLLTHIVYK
jgi:hypothetical protein